MKKMDAFNDYPEQLVEWELTISGYDGLSQSDKDLVRGIISKSIEVFNDFEGRFSITKDEEEDNEKTTWKNMLAL